MTAAYALAPMAMVNRAGGGAGSFDVCKVGARLPYSSFLVKGDEVEFLRAGTKEKTYIPASFLMLHDVTKHHYRRCDFFIVKSMRLHVDRVTFDERTVYEAQEYYGDRVKLGAVGFALPTGSWNSVGLVDEIHYRRHPSNPQPLLAPVRIGGRYTHSFASNVPLREAGSGNAWRVALPSGCLVDAHGFVTP